MTNKPHLNEPGRKQAASSPLWVASKPGERRVGRHPVYYAGIGVLMAIVLLALITLDVIIVVLGRGDGGLGTPYTPVGFIEVAGYAVILAFVGVLWPIGILSQVALDFSLSARSRNAPRGVSVARVTRAASLGATFDPLVQTSYTRRWTAIGNLGWLPNLRIAIGALGIALALLTLGSFHGWLADGASAAILAIAVVVFAVVGIAFLALGVRGRFAKLATTTAAKAQTADAERRSEHREEVRRARLSPEELAAEDAQLANLIPKDPIKPTGEGKTHHTAG